MKRKTPNGWWNQRAQQRQGPTIGDYLMTIALAAEARLRWFQDLLISWNYFKMLAGRMRRPVAPIIATLADARATLAAAAAARGATANAGGAI